MDAWVYRYYKMLMMVVWDEPKRLANLDKHGIDFADIGEDFFASALIGPARKWALVRHR